MDSISSFGRKVGSWVGRGVGKVGSTLRQIGQTTMPVLRKIGDFAVQNHQPLAMLAQGVADISGNDTAKTIAGLGMMGSAALTAAGVGRDYMGVNRMA